jgi:hypothetical protein
MTERIQVSWVELQFAPAAAGAAYELQALPGAVTLAGTSVSLRVGRKLQVTAGAIVLAGQNVTLRPTRKMQAGAGAVVLSGKNVNLRYSGEGYILQPGGDPVSIIISGASAETDWGNATFGQERIGQTFLSVGTRVDKISALVGKLGTPVDGVCIKLYTTDAQHLPATLLGTSNVVVGNTLLDNDTAMVEFTFTPQIAVASGVEYAWAFERTGALNDFNEYMTKMTDLPTYAGGSSIYYGSGAWGNYSGNYDTPCTITQYVAGGTISLSGKSVTLRRTHKLTATAGAVALSGKNVTLRPTRKMQAGTGAIAVAGQTVTLRATRKMPVGTGAVVLAGKSAVLKWSREGASLSAQPGAVTLAGQSVTLRYARKLVVTKGIFTLAGQSVTLRTDRKLVMTFPPNILIGSQNVNLIHGISKTLTALPGAIILSGKSVNLAHKTPARMTAQPGAIVLAGSSVNLIPAVNYKLTVLPGGIVLQGEPIMLRRGKSLAAGTGAIVISGETAARTGYVLRVAAGAVKVTPHVAYTNYFKKFTEQPGRLVFGRPGFKYIANRW